jgi:hypothetical protein
LLLLLLQITKEGEKGEGKIRGEYQLIRLFNKQAVKLMAA